MMHVKIDDETSRKVPSRPNRRFRLSLWAQGLPLLRKDLHELSMRPRTYVERVAYVSALILICYLSSPISLWKTLISRLDYLGIGGRFFVIIVSTQKIGLFLALPALACSCITQERQRGTFDLLRITSLSPTNIILEKFLSRLAPALNLVLISSPVVAFCYPLGGVSAVDIFQALLDLTLISIRLTAMGVMFSAIRATSQQALIATYFWFLAIGFVIHMALVLLLDLIDRDLAFELLSLYWLGSHGVSIAPFLISSVYSILITAVCLNWGRVGLQKTPLRPEMVTATPLGLSARSEFRTHRTNDLDFPQLDPITWRLRLNRVNGRQSDFAESLAGQVLLFVHALAIGIAVSLADATFALALWAFTTVVLTVLVCFRESGKIARERTKQTLAVLLTTPLVGAEIVRQNQVNSIDGMRFWRPISAGWIAGVMVFHFDLIVLIQGVLAICVYPLIVKWQISVCDLTSKNENLAMLKSLSMLAIRFVGPLMIVGMFGTTIKGLWGAGATRNARAIAYAISPLSMFGGRLPDSGRQWELLMLSMLANCGLAFYLWRKANCYADYYLGRLDGHVSADSENNADR